MLRLSALFILLALSAISFSCRKQTGVFDQHIFSFDTDKQGWEVLYSDYPVGAEVQFKLEWGLQPLPDPLDSGKKTLMVRGTNHSDDLLQMIYRKFSGLEPNRRYAISVGVRFASNVATNSVGIGGSPELAIGAGALNYQPANIVEPVGSVDYYRPNFVSRLQSRLSNDTFQVMGTIGVSDNTNEYTLINRNNFNQPVYVTSNANGEIWVLIGIDSGFEGETRLYYDRVEVRLK